MEMDDTIERLIGIIENMTDIIQTQQFEAQQLRSVITSGYNEITEIKRLLKDLYNKQLISETGKRANG